MATPQPMKVCAIHLLIVCVNIGIYTFKKPQRRQTLQLKVF